MPTIPLKIDLAPDLAKFKIDLAKGAHAAAIEATKQAVVTPTLNTDTAKKALSDLAALSVKDIKKIDFGPVEASAKKHLGAAAQVATKELSEAGKKGGAGFSTGFTGHLGKLTASVKNAFTGAAASGSSAGAKAGKDFHAQFAGYASKLAGPVAAALGGLSIGGILKGSVDEVKKVTAESQKLARFMGSNIEDASKMRGAFTLMGVGVDQTVPMLKKMSTALQQQQSQMDKAKEKTSAMAEKTREQIRVLEATAKPTAAHTAKLQILREKLADLTGPQAAAAKGSNAFAIELQDSTGHLRKLTDILPEVAEQFKTMKDGPEKVAYAVKLFGRSGADLIPFLNKGKDGIAALNAQAAELGLTVDEKTSKALKESNANTRVFNASISGLKTQIGVGLLPMVTDLTMWVQNKFIPAFKKAAEWVRDHNKEILAATKFVVGFVAPLALLASGALKAVAAYNALTAAVATYKAAQVAAAAAGKATGFAAMLNPVGLVIAAIVALGAALYVAYQKSETFRNIVNNTWNTIKDTVTRVWNGNIKPALDAFGRWFTGTAVPAIKQFWDGTLRPALVNAGNGIAAFWNNHAKPAFESFRRVIVETVIPAARDLWARAQPIFRDIGNAIRMMWENVVKPVFTALTWYVQNVVGPVYTWLWNTIIQPVFGFIGAFISKVWEVQIKVALAAFATAVKVLGPVISWLWDSIIKPYYTLIGSLISATWNNVIQPALSAFGKFILDTVAPAFVKGVGIISGVWNTLKSALATPVKFVVETIINKGIIGTFNSLIAAAHLPDSLKINDVPVPDFLGGGDGGKPQQIINRPNGVKLMADGGLVDGWSPHDRADNIPANLTAGEFVLPVAARKRLENTIGVHGLESLRQGTFPSGSDENPGRRAGGPRTTPISGAGPGDSGVWRQLAAWVKSHLPGAIITSAYRNTYTATGNVSNHARGMAVDIAGPNMMGYFNAIRNAYPNSLELIHTPAGGNQLRGGRPFTYSGVTAANHYDHVHWAMSSLTGGGGGGFLGWAADGIADKVKQAVGGLIDGAGKVIPGFPDSFLGKFAKGATGKVIDGLRDKLVPFQSSGEASSDVGGGTLPAGEAVARWAGTVRQALGIAGLPVTDNYVNAWLRQISSESSGNPKAVQGNIGDVNNRSGDLAKGLVQVIGATFAAYRDKSLPNDRFDPLANLVAGMRYAKARYKHILSVIGHGHGYESGGHVFGPAGRDNVPAWLTAGEFVLPKQSTDQLRDRLGPAGLEQLRQGVMPKFADGGIVGATFGLTGAKANVMDALLGKYTETEQLSAEAQKIADSVTRFKDAMAGAIKPTDELAQKVKDAQAKVTEANAANTKAVKAAQDAVKTASGKTGAAQKNLTAAQKDLATVQRNRRAKPAQVAAARKKVEAARAKVDAARVAEAKAKQKLAEAGKSTATAQAALRKAQDEAKINQARIDAQTKINTILDAAAPKLQALADEVASTQKSLDAAKQTLDDAKRALADYSAGLQQNTMGKFGLTGLYEQLKEKKSGGNGEMDTIASNMIRGDYSGSSRYKELLGQQTMTAPGGGSIVSDITSAMREGVTKVKQFSETINALNVAGLDKGLIKQLVDGGIDAAPLAEAIKAAGPGALAELNAVNSQLQLESKLSADAFSEIVYDQQIYTAQQAVDAWTAAMEMINGQMAKTAELIREQIAGVLKSALGKDYGGPGAAPDRVAPPAKKASEIVAEIAAKRKEELAQQKAGQAAAKSGATMAARTAADLKTAGLAPTTVVNFTGQVGASATQVIKAVSTAQTKASILAGVR